MKAGASKKEMTGSTMSTLGSGAQAGPLLWHRRHAMQIGMQLPEGHHDALMVLEAARAMVLSFLQEDPVDQPLLPEPREPGGGVVLAFVVPGGANA
jgi:hypothetical protein